MPHAVQSTRHAARVEDFPLMQQASIAAVLAQSAQESRIMKTCWLLHTAPTFAYPDGCARALEIWLMLLAAWHI